MEASFEQFAVTLIAGVMDALVTSAVQQMKSFADMVSTIENGLAAFQAQINPATGTGIIAWIRANLPDVTIGDDGKMTIGAKWSASSVTALADLFSRASQVAGTTLKLNDATAHTVDQTLTGTAISKAEFIAGANDPTTTAGLMSPQHAVNVKTGLNPAGQATILDAINAVLNSDAELAYAQLNALVKMGLYRVVVTDGHILTKATFSLQANDQFNQSSTDISASSFAANGRASYGGKRFSAALAASYSTVNIRVANTSSSVTTNINEVVMGEVLVNFKGDYFPSAPVPAAP